MKNLMSCVLILTFLLGCQKQIKTNLASTVLPGGYEIYNSMDLIPDPGVPPDPNAEMNRAYAAFLILKAFQPNFDGSQDIVSDLDDVENVTFRNYAKKFRSDLITVGCGVSPLGKTHFCPSQAIPLWQFLVFTVRSMHKYGSLSYDALPTHPLTPEETAKADDLKNRWGMSEFNNLASVLPDSRVQGIIEVAIETNLIETDCHVECLTTNAVRVYKANNILVQALKSPVSTPTEFTCSLVANDISRNVKSDITLMVEPQDVVNYSIVSNIPSVGLKYHWLGSLKWDWDTGDYTPDLDIVTSSVNTFDGPIPLSAAGGHYKRHVIILDSNGQPLCDTAGKDPSHLLEVFVDDSYKMQIWDLSYAFKINPIVSQEIGSDGHPYNLVVVNGLFLEGSNSYKLSSQVYKMTSDSGGYCQPQIFDWMDNQGRPPLNQVMFKVRAESFNTNCNYKITSIAYGFETSFSIPTVFHIDRASYLLAGDGHTDSNGYTYNSDLSYLKLSGTFKNFSTSFQDLEVRYICTNPDGSAGPRGAFNQVPGSASETQITVEAPASVVSSMSCQIGLYEKPTYQGSPSVVLIDVNSVSPLTIGQ